MGHDHHKEHEHNHSLGCTCSDCHHHDEDEKSEIGLKIIRLVLAALFFVFGILYEKVFNFTIINEEWDLFIIYLISYLIIGYDVIIESIVGIFKGRFLDETFLMTIASICAFLTKENDEAVLVMWLFQLGEMLQDIAVDNSHKSIENLLNLKEVHVHIINNDVEEDKDVTDVKVGEIYLVRPGERLPLDGVIVSGQTSLDMSSLTGEAIPVLKQAGDEVLSGSINSQNIIKVKVNKVYDDSTVAKILDCIEKATVSKTQNEQFVTKFAKIYTPIVCGLALLIVIVGLIIGGDINDLLSKVAGFLVISCPCALVISVPLAYFIGIGVSSTNGILMKGSNFLEILDKADTILFDKTGTLTSGKMHIDEVVSSFQEELVNTISIAETYSTHPIASVFDKTLAQSHKIEDYQEEFGKGVSCKIDGIPVKVGSSSFVGVKKVKINKTGTIIHCKKDDKYLGYIVIKDSVKLDAKTAIDTLKQTGVKTVMVSGDNKASAEEIGTNLGIDEVRSELLPHQKVEVLDEYMKNKDHKVAFVGDGINDAPSIAKSDIGIAMGGLGSGAAIEMSDIVVMNDSLTSLINAKKISKATVKIVYENIIAIIIVKAAALAFAAFGDVPVWLLLFSDVGICLLTILNSLRLFMFAYIGKNKKYSKKSEVR